MDRNVRGCARAVLLVVAAVAWADRCPAAEGALKDRLLAEAPAAWRRSEELLTDRLDAEMNIARLEGIGPENKGQAPQRRRLHLLSKGRSRLVVSGPVDGAPSEVLGINPRYAFRLGRDGDQSPYFLMYMGNDAEGVAKLMRGAGAYYLDSPWRLFEKDLRLLIAEPGFRIKDVSAVRRGAASLAKLDFDYKPAPSDNTRIRGGSVLLDPNQHWSVQEADLAFIANRAKIEVEYGEASDGLPSLRRVTILISSLDGKRVLRDRCEFESWSRRDVPDREFTLRAFGLPELDAPPKKAAAIPLNYLLLGLALVFGAIAFFLRRPGRRGGSDRGLPVPPRTARSLGPDGHRSEGSEMPRLRSIAFAASALLAALSFALALADWGVTGRGAAPDPERLAYDPIQDVGAITRGSEVEATFAITNRSRVTRMLVGANSRCGQVCVTTRGLPLAIPPRGSGLVRVTVTAGSSLGDFRQGLTVYTDSPGQSEIPLTFVGRLVEPTEASPLESLGRGLSALRPESRAAAGSREQ